MTADRQPKKRKRERTVNPAALISGVGRRNNWTCIEPGCWQLDRTADNSADGRGIRLEFDRQYGWCLWGEYISIFPAGREYGWSLDNAMKEVEQWAVGWGWRRVRGRKVRRRAGRRVR